MKQIDVLDSINWAEGEFGSMVTTTECPRRDVMRCVSKGLAKSIGQVHLCDGDGFTLYPERFREGFVLTDEGRTLLESMDY